MQPSTLPYPSVFKARPSQLHLHLNQRETMYTWPLKLWIQRPYLYLIECKIQRKQYFGETKRHLHKRFGSIAAPFSTMATLLILLLSPNILIEPITLSKTSFLSVATVTDSVRKARKAHGLINKAITTHGINRRELNWWHLSFSSLSFSVYYVFKSLICNVHHVSEFIFLL